MQLHWGNKKAVRLYSIVLVISSLLTSTGCAGIVKLVPTITPTPTTTNTPTLTPTPTSTYTPTPTSTPTSTPTNTPTPTATSSPTPTPTPVGYYYNPDLQFSITVPPDWDLEEYEQQIQFYGPDEDIFLLAESLEIDTDYALDYCVLLTEYYQDPDTGVFISSTQGKKDEVVYGDGTVADRQIISGRNVSGDDLTVELSCAVSFGRLYSFTFAGPTIGMKAKQNLITGIYETITLAENPLLAQGPTNSDSIAGEWSGKTVGIDNTSFSTQIDLAIQPGCTVGKYCGTVSAPQLPCTGKIILESIVGNTFTFVEWDMQGSSSCVNGGHEYVRLETTDTLSWSYLYSNTDTYDQTASSAILQRK